MNYLNRSLLRIGLLSTVVGLTTVAHAQPGRANPGRATTTIQSDTTIISKDTVAGLVTVPTVPDTLLKERLAKLQKTIPLNYHPSVQGYVDLFTFRRAAYTKTMLEKMPLFFPLYERMLKQYGMPDELKYLSIVESSLNPRAVSRSGAGGLWQFMPGTGRDMRLYQDEYIDERMDPVKATEAACKYMRDLYNIFGDWELAMAAYNCGPGAVKRAMRRTGGDSFYTIFDALPKETRGYVPLFVTFTYMMNYAEAHGIIAEKHEYPIPHDTIQISGYFNLESFARNTKISLADLQKMNPAIMTTILPEHTNLYSLRIPRTQYDYFAANRRAILDSARHIPGFMEHVLLAQTEWVGQQAGETNVWASLNRNPLANINVEKPTAEIVALVDSEIEEDEEVVIRPAKTVVIHRTHRQTYVVRKGDNLGEVAERYNVGMSELKHWNHLRKNTLQRGQKLVILKEVTETRTEPIAGRSSTKTSKLGVAVRTKQYKPRYHKVQSGDTLWNIVRRYDLTIEQLKKMNHIKNNELRPGQKLIVG